LEAARLKVMPNVVLGVGVNPRFFLSLYELVWLAALARHVTSQKRQKTTHFTRTPHSSSIDTSITTQLPAIWLAQALDASKSRP